jgi:hypothetical protein
MRSALKASSVLIIAGLLLAAWPENGRSSASPPTERSLPDLNLAIIVNRSNTVEDLSMGELRKIFLGERSHWANGRRITLVMMEAGQPEQKAVLQQICRMTDTQYRNHILRRLFTGELLVSPKTLATPTGVRKFVFNVPGAIGYVRATDVDTTVRVVRVAGLLPDDKDYSLHVEEAHQGQQ